MGAEHFETHSELTDVAKAFNQAVEDALWEHGHGGYTGTIAEKDGYIVFEVPEGHTVDETVRAVERLWYETVDWLPEGMEDAYEDKWGPAIAIRDGDGWLFFGLAST